MESLMHIANAGAGAVVSKSLGIEPRRGYGNPTVVQVEGGVLNAMGLPNPGIQVFIQEMAENRLTVPLILSLYAFTPKEFATVAAKASVAGVDGLELNVSCPHASGTGQELGRDPKLIRDIVKAVRDAVNIPLFVKLTPNVTNIVELAEAAERAGASGITAINTVKAMAIDIETAKPILANKIGGLSGSAVRPIALRCVYEIYESVKIPIIGCGGVDSWQATVQFLQAGASAVQIGTAIATRGLSIFKEVSDGVEMFLKRKCYGSVKEIVGLSHRS
jgi:dihydroorotate dehydrogenase (NAD+) catalytic subunit